ncbi:MAG: hypothetical protein J6036_02755 [Clostridia bacterium]|nr:hypothetical protein [Clostridia bacterium]
MTDIPKMGFLCAGKTPLELSASIHCAYKIMKVLNSAGYENAGYYTKIYSAYDKEKEEKTKNVLERLCSCCDLVLTVGCEGFSACDVIPEITEKLCEKKVGYFSNILNGSRSIKNINERGKETVMRLFPDEKPQGAAGEFSFSPFCGVSGAKDGGKAVNNGKPHKKSVAARIFSASPPKKTKFYALPSEKQSFSDDYVCARPSRASSGILKSALILNMSNDVYTAIPLIKAVLPAVNFAVYNISGKSAADFSSYKDEVKYSINFNKL